MSLTKGQKDALVRRALAIAQEQRDKKRNEIIANYKPTKEEEKMLAAFREVYEARQHLIDVVKKNNFNIFYSQIGAPTGSPVSTTVYLSDDSSVDALMKDVIETIATKDFKFNLPCDSDIYDDLELAGLSKDFDVDAFLAKYQNL